MATKKNSLPGEMTTFWWIDFVDFEFSDSVINMN
jgi:hypothetical protein